MRIRKILVIAMTLAPNLAVRAWTGELPAYKPQPVTLAIEATYVSPDDSILIVGSHGTEKMLTEFNELFVTTHPAFKFRLLARGLPSIALYGIITGISAFALVDREIWPLEVRPFRQTYGYEPTGIRIGHAGYTARGRMNPPGIYVNAKNPLAGLTVDQAARIFTTGGGNGDMTHWGQLGLPGAWAERLIHLYGPRDDGSLISAIRHAKMGGLPFASRYEPLSTYAGVIRAVADDPYGIGLAGFYDASAFSRAVKQVPLAEAEGTPYSGSSYREVLAGQYPFSPHLHLYANRASGKRFDPFVKEYARLALSREGQAIVAAQKDAPYGYLPLSEQEVIEELNKLEK
jgi:phosphate transport system substrate-binding protein